MQRTAISTTVRHVIFHQRRAPIQQQHTHRPRKGATRKRSNYFYREKANTTTLRRTSIRTALNAPPDQSTSMTCWHLSPTQESLSCGHTTVINSSTHMSRHTVLVSFIMVMMWLGPCDVSVVRTPTTCCSSSPPQGSRPGWFSSVVCTSALSYTSVALLCLSGLRRNLRARRPVA
jgi:hypothetical protein